VPLRAPSSEPVSMTPSVCSVMGTLLPNAAMAPGRPSAATRPAPIATWATSREVRRLLLGFMVCAA
jgi:hypothetical protein